jgi:hypothetical protein
MSFPYEEPDCRPDWRLLSEKTSKARTQKICDICGGPIEVGHQYRTIAAIDDGSFDLRREHLSSPECAHGAEQRDQWERDAWSEFSAEAQPLPPSPN